MRNGSIMLGIGEKLFFLTLVSIACLVLTSYPVSATDVFVEYFHMSGCQDCKKTDPIIAEIERSYNAGIKGNVTFEYIDTGTQEGLKNWERYGFLEIPAIVINKEVKIPKEEITKENITIKINAYLNDTEETTNNNSINDDIWGVPLAFSMGVFSGFSPCLMAILGFILSYTAGTSRGMKDGIGRAVVFGIGLVTAYIMLGVCMLVYGKSLFGVGVVSVIGGVVSILIGLSMLGILKIPVTLDDYVKGLAKNC
ncbi:MAG: cytochrome c biogenesis protein CcdA, partial [Bacteroidales bacterium]|nr:cytochrome c biogenesis protein CcdA [Bacteroidales bacterium]